MKCIKKALLISFFFSLTSSYTFSKTNGKNIEYAVITHENITQCEFEHGYFDFCSNENLKLYNNALSKQENFSQNKIALIIDHERDTGKGVPRKVKYFIVIDPKIKKVYPLEQSIGYFVNDRLEEIATEPPTIKFSQNSNKVCLSGTTFSYKNNNINVKNECYVFDINNHKYFNKYK